MNKQEKIVKYKDKRANIKKDMKALMKEEDGKTKFRKLISLAKEYENITMDMNLLGCSVKVYPESMTSDYWKTIYDEYINNDKKTKEQSKNKKYTISIFWTVENNSRCNCVTLLDKVKLYFIKMNMKLEDITETAFPDRIEYCSIYSIKCTEAVYKTIMTSAEYIIDIAAETSYDKCNIGLVGSF